MPVRPALVLALCVSLSAEDVDRLTWVPEAREYTLVYALDLHHLGAPPVYDTDRTAEVTRPFTRVAYFLELQRPDEMLFYVWVSMDAFTTDPRRTGIPAGWTFQQRVTRLRIVSNAAAVTSGELAEGNLEFWPNNYREANAARVPGAKDDVYDCGDQPDGGTPAGYGSMQVHDFAAQRTIFALNNWREMNGQADIGIGACPGRCPDWTFAANAADYQTRRLRVFVKPAP